MSMNKVQDSFLGIASCGGGSSFREQQDGFPGTQEHPELMLEGNFNPLLVHINYSVVFGLRVYSRHPSTCVCMHVLVSCFCEAGIILGVWSEENLPPHLLKEI